MSDEKQAATPPTIYSAPAPEAFDAFARKVCQKLGDEYTTPDVVNGFSAFIKVVAEIQVKHLNRQQENVEAS
ncbi:MAG: hypothetical protein K8I82_10225 [Anaerolineae bacterium]|nr:hypothetical protein [Anaerolineae bacterium]